MCYLCRQHNISPDNVIGHYEGYQKGIASNHGDPKNWFPKHGKSMDTFRADVTAGLSSAIKAPTTPNDTGKLYRVQFGAYSVKANADAMLTKLKKYGVDGYIKYD